MSYNRQPPPHPRTHAMLHVCAHDTVPMHVHTMLCLHMYTGTKPLGGGGVRGRTCHNSPRQRCCTGSVLPHRLDVCTCEHAHVCACVYVRVCACTRACMSARVRACARACVHAHVRVCVRVCMRACMRACVRACLHACVRACVRACVCAHVRAHVRAHV